MAQKVGSKTTFEVSKTIAPIHVGGAVALSRNGRILATCLGEDALLTDLATGTELGRIEGVRLRPLGRLRFYLTLTRRTGWRRNHSNDP